MKTVIFATLALACMLGLTLGQGYFGSGVEQESSFGGIGSLFLLLIILPLIFNLFGARSSPSTSIVVGNFSTTG